LFFLEKRTTKNFIKRTTKNFRKRTTKNFRKRTTKNFRKRTTRIEKNNYKTLKEGVVGENLVSLQKN
jgi:urate oxidase